jgi:ATP-dependent DNA helicase RecQ
LADLSRELKVPRVLALTATATPSVLKDIRQAFSIEPDDVVQTQFFRPNLQLLSRVVGEEQRDKVLLESLRDRERGATLIYVTLQKTTTDIVDLLTRHGFEARAYHAGMTPEERVEVQNWFLRESSAIVVATIAFGMGIDKSDIRYVYHYNPSKSIESYAQEIGRAGRDGADSICETLMVPSDRTVLDNFAYGDTPERTSVRRLVDIVRGQGELFHISHYKLSAETDIRILVVRTLLTYLELDGYLKGTSPRYDTYQFKPLVTSKVILSNFEGERRKLISDLLCTAVKRRKLFEIPLTIATQRLNQPRERLVKAIDYLHERGWIELSVSDVVFGYKKLMQISEPEELADELYERLVSREESEIERSNQLQKLLLAPSCQAALLSDHFGQRLEQACGRCTSCLGSGPLTLPVSASSSIGRSALTAVRQLAARKPEALGSPRAQARFLCGLSSPALTKARLTKDPMFGVCEMVPFARVLQQLET